MKEAIKKYGTERIFDAILDMFLNGDVDESLSDITLMEILDYITSSRDFRRFIVERKK